MSKDFDDMIDEIREISEWENKTVYRVYCAKGKGIEVVSYRPHAPSYYGGNHIEDFDEERFITEEFDTEDEASEQLFEIMMLVIKLKSFGIV